MQATQIYAEVNSLVAQATGDTTLTAIDNNSLIALGNTVLSSTTYTENFLNTLVQRIGKTIISVRQYQSMFSDLMMDTMEWGNIVQKISISVSGAETDQAYDLTDGAGIDMYKIQKPTVTQKLFTSMTPRQIMITIQKKQLRQAFTSAESMGSFFAGVMIEVQNEIEIQMESLGRNCLINYIGEIANTTRAINLLSEYNTATGSTLTVAQAKVSEPFLRWTLGYIKQMSTRLTSMSLLYNDGTKRRHTPKESQKLYIMTEWNTAFETQVHYSAFNDSYLKLPGFKELPFLQAEDTPNSVSVVPASAGGVGNPVEVDNIIGCLFDINALGIFKKEEDVSTTPFNSAGLYANTYWHLLEMYYNDLSENFLMFYIA